MAAQETNAKTQRKTKISELKLTDAQKRVLTILTQDEGNPFTIDKIAFEMGASYGYISTILPVLKAGALIEQIPGRKKNVYVEVGRFEV